MDQSVENTSEIENLGNSLDAVDEPPTPNEGENGSSAELMFNSSKKPKKNPAPHPSTSAMVLESIKTLKKRNGATAEAIQDYIEENYQVDMKKIKPRVKQYLKQAVDKGILSQLTGAAGKEKFKVQKTETVKKHPPTSAMVLESIKTLKMRNGAPVEAIQEHIDANYQVEMKKIKPRVKQYLKQAVEKGILLQLTGAAGVEKFKVNKAESVKKEKKTTPGTKRKSEPVKEIAQPKKRAK